MTRLAEGEPLYPEDPDLPLVTAMAQGDAEALEELYRRCGPRLLAYLSARLGNSGLAEEVLQDVMLAAWQGAARFHGTGRAWAWLMAIARNRAINAYHRQVQPDSVVESEADMDGEQLEMPGLGELPELEEGSQQGQALQQALSGLPAAQRETLDLVFFQGLSLEETAQVMGVAEGTIKSRLHRARARLKEGMKGAPLTPPLSTAAPLPERERGAKPLRGAFGDERGGTSGKDDPGVNVQEDDPSD